MFATTGGNVRRNELADFSQVNRNGKIAMKLEEGESIASVQLCTEQDDVLLTTANGACIRFPVTDVRVFKGRDSVGVRGIRLESDDKIISMAIILHSNASPEERLAYLRVSGAERRASGSLGAGADDPTVIDAGIEMDAEETVGDQVEVNKVRHLEMQTNEQFILTVSENGYGKRTSSYEYRVTGRGGKGIVAMAVNERNGKLIASFPVDEADQIMLVTDGGQLIRCPVDQIGVKGRSTQGVTVFNTAQGEKVVSVERVTDEGDSEDGEAEAGPAPESPSEA
ncbi:MAG: hypothetical protein B7Z40_20530 [Bosea sp. 12-68-7]|nr:MAG: hypothetical protein B7Z40_20530 [Bosea sp. 12-68-7]